MKGNNQEVCQRKRKAIFILIPGYYGINGMLFPFDDLSCPAGLFPRNRKKSCKAGKCPVARDALEDERSIGLCVQNRHYLESRFPEILYKEPPKRHIH